MVLRPAFTPPGRRCGSELRSWGPARGPPRPLALRPCAATQQPDLTFAFLDDVYLAGGPTTLDSCRPPDWPHLEPAKCVLSGCSIDSVFDRRLFSDGIVFNGSGAFSLLGAPVGNGTFSDAFTTTKRVEAAVPLLQAIAELGDPQTGLLLLRERASFCKVVFACRATPPLNANALDCLDRYGYAWRGCARSCLHCLRCCHSDALPVVGPPLGEALTTYNQSVQASDRVPDPVPLSLRQQTQPPAFRALELLQGAGAWLHAPPAQAPVLFRLMVRLRLRLQASHARGRGVPIGRWGSGQLGRPCPCTKRHNRLRSIPDCRTQCPGRLRLC